MNNGEIFPNLAFNQPYQNKTKEVIQMNFGTKLRTALRAAISINTAIYVVSSAVTGLGFGKLTLIWTILTIASDFVVAAITTYYNNDYNETSAKYTGMMRLEKKQMAGKIDGENFYDEIQDFDEEDEDEELIEEEEE